MLSVTNQTPTQNTRITAIDVSYYSFITKAFSRALRSSIPLTSPVSSNSFLVSSDSKT